MAARKTKSTKADRTELIEALNAIEKEKQISKDIILEAIENSLLAACKNQFGKSENIRVNIDRETGEVKVFADYEVVEDDMIEDDALQIGITEAKLRFRDDVEVGEKVSTEVTPHRMQEMSFCRRSVRKNAKCCMYSIWKKNVK